MFLSFYLSKIRLRMFDLLNTLDLIFRGTQHLQPWLTSVGGMSVQLFCKSGPSVFTFTFIWISSSAGARFHYHRLVFRI